MRSTDFINNDMESTCNQLDLTAHHSIYRIKKGSNVKRWVLGIFVFLLLLLFLPWTQNIRSRGTVTTLYQDQRPQQLNTIIPGKVKKWHVKEGDYVKAGDTIVHLSEIKDDYLDPQLLQRTKEQLDAKQQSIEGYKNKAGTAGQQINALSEARRLKLADLQNKIGQQVYKIRSDSMELQAAINDYSIKEQQYRRQKVMHDSGLVSLTQLEQRNQAFQDALAKRTSAEIKYGNSKQEFFRLQIELNGENQQYLEKISKAEGDRFQSISQIATGEGEIAKLSNQYMNYDIRSRLYYILAPQSGQVVQAKKAGIGEIVKEGELIVEIVPDKIEYAVEMYVRPLDLPLLQTGQKVRFMFDGFPAIVFSGWPQASYGTFGGEVFAVESKVTDKGMFKVLVKEDRSDRPWPKELKMGTGASGMALLKNVMIWYELWRNINGFPPDFYTPEQQDKKTTVAK
jgi:multidrug efflux pump subunit AcrA (membrane-fusion protein)